MTPKEKAEELIEQYEQQLLDTFDQKQRAKQCALIAVETVITTQQKNWFSGKQ